ncbi:MAG: hypothetical protein AAGE99_00195 [Chlamydiota bacterium]
MKSKLSFLLLGCLMLGTQAFAAESVSSQVTASIKSIQNLVFPGIDIGEIDPNATGLSDGFYVKNGSTVTAQSNGGNGYTVVVTQDGRTAGALFQLDETSGGTDTMELYLYKGTSMDPGVNENPPPADGQLVVGSEVFNFSEQTLNEQLADLQVALPGAQFTTISEGSYMGTITMTLTDN